MFNKRSRTKIRVKTVTTVRRRGQTLLDVAVAAAVITMAALLLYPALSTARGHARTTSCATILQNFGQSMAIYAADNEDWLPGNNTTGLEVSELAYLWQQDPNVLAPPDQPVQTFDWMTPLLRQSEVLPTGRAAKWNYLWTQYRCPQQDWTSVVYAGSAVPDIDGFLAMNPWPACSYLMPAAFQYWGVDPNRPWLRPSIGRRIIPDLPPEDWWEIGADMWPTHWSPQVPPNFRPKLTTVGPADRKIFAADGTRYVTNEGIISHDVTLHPTSFGGFTSSGAWWAFSTAYGVEEGSLNWDGDHVTTGSVSNGRNLRYSYRHRAVPTRAKRGDRVGDRSQAILIDSFEIKKLPPLTHAQGNLGAMHAVFFDGHVSLMHDRQSRNPALWYPTGSVVTDGGDGMTTLEPGTVIP